MFTPYGAWQDTTIPTASNFMLVFGTTAVPLPNYYVAYAIAAWLQNVNDPNNSTFPTSTGQASVSPLSLISAGGVTLATPSLANMPYGISSPQLGAKVLFMQTVTSLPQADAIRAAAAAAVPDGTLCKALVYNMLQCFAAPAAQSVSPPAQTPNPAGVAAAAAGAAIAAGATAALADSQAALAAAKSDLADAGGVSKIAVPLAVIFGVLAGLMALAALVRARSCDLLCVCLC
jgi:hypothetical protein